MQLCVWRLTILKHILHPANLYSLSPSSCS
jgi:hypothetical protein